MVKFIKYSLLLALIGVVCAVGVAVVYVVTEDRVEQNRTSQRDKSLKVIFGSKATFEESDLGTAKDPIWAARDPDGKLLGYALVGKAQGYSSVLEVLVGTDPGAKTVRGIKVLFQQETPGLGANVAEKEKESLWASLGRLFKGGEAPPEPPFSAYEDQFKGKSLAEAKLKKQNGEIDAMTAATITSNAVVEAVHNAATRLQDQLKDTTTP